MTSPSIGVVQFSVGRAGDSHCSRTALSVGAVRGKAKLAFVRAAFLMPGRQGTW